MPSHVALLRGINVGGNNKVAMADLRRIVTELGHTEVTTYIQSGNVVFSAAARDSTALAADLERAIVADLGVAPRVVVLTREELARVVADNPHPDEPNPKLLHAIFLTEAPGRQLQERLAAAQDRVAQKGSRDTAQLLGRTVYLHTPDGFGRSELAAQLSKPTVISGTARNWATVTKLLALCDG